MAEQLNFFQLIALIGQQYPELMPILQKPGILDAVGQAVKGNWSPARLQAALQATPYYRDTDAPHRAWDILTAVDPTTANQRLKQYQMRVTDLVNQTGVKLDPTQQQQLLTDAVANQWSDSEIRLNLVYEAGNMVGKPATAEMQNNITQVDSLASDYGVTLSAQTEIDWASKLTAGAVDTNAVKGYMIEQAKSMYPGLAGAIDAGFTVRQYADPYAQIAARELNINPDDFQLTDPKWSMPLAQVDPKTGQRQAMSLDQWQTTVRTDPRYGYDKTQGAQAQAASLVTTLEQKFGNAA